MNRILIVVFILLKPLTVHILVNTIIFQRNSLPGVFTIIDNHLCKSEPFDAANFGLKCDGVKPLFMGNVGVTLHVPEKHDQYRDTDIQIPPPVLQVQVFK